MRKILLASSILMISLTACQKNATAPDAQTIQQKTTSDTYLSVITEDLDYFVGLYEDGDIMTFSVKNGTVVQTLSNDKNGNQALAEHDHTDTNKIAFAQWCDKQLKAGHTLKVGYDKSTGTYWADIIS